MKIEVRQVYEADHNFIFATYLRRRWFDKDNKTTLQRSTWSALQHKRLEGILDAKAVVVACLSEDNDTILGYAFLDKDGPFVYLKKAWRAPGLALEDKLLKEIR